MKRSVLFVLGALAIAAFWQALYRYPLFCTRHGAQHESGATPKAAGAKTCRRQQVLIRSKENLGTYCSYNPFLLCMHTRTILGH